MLASILAPLRNQGGTVSERAHKSDWVANAYQKARWFVGESFARCGRDAQHVEHALGFGGIVGDNVFALCVRHEHAVVLPVLFVVASTSFQIGLRRWGPRRGWEEVCKWQRGWRWWHGWSRRAGRRQRAGRVVEALDLGRDHGWALPKQKVEARVVRAALGRALHEAVVGLRKKNANVACTE